MHVSPGFAKALAYTLHVATHDPDPRVREGAVTMLLDALERRPPRAAHIARFCSANPMQGRTHDIGTLVSQKRFTFGRTWMST